MTLTRVEARMPIAACSARVDCIDLMSMHDDQVGCINYKDVVEVG